MKIIQTELPDHLYHEAIFLVKKLFVISYSMLFLGRKLIGYRYQYHSHTCHTNLFSDAPSILRIFSPHGRSMLDNFVSLCVIIFSHFRELKVLRTFTPEEIDHLPEKHDARSNPALTIERSEIQRLDMPPFAKVKNRVEVIFYGAPPEIENDMES